MKTADEQRDSWQQIGRAAEDLARRVARDAAHFATRLEEHVGAFASEIGREWRGAEAAARDPVEDVRRVFADVRGVVSAVLEGVDEIITSAFSPSPAGDDPWARVTVNHDGVCAACARPIAAGVEAFARRLAGSHQLRCTGCGVP